MKKIVKQKNKLTGVCTCPGEVAGMIRYYQKNKKYSKKDVVVLDEWLTQGVSLLKNVGALLSSTGGLTCHASVIAREYNIPCLVSVKGLDKIKDGTKVRIDAAAEELIIL